MSITSEEVRKVEHSIKSEEWGRNDTRGIVVNQIFRSDLISKLEKIESFPCPCPS